jgi:GNAT superfamily N-acetyltransferase
MSSHLPPEVILLPKTFYTPADLDNIANRYKNIRLQGLLSDPDSFSSTYERESQFTLDIWRSRIQNPVAKTFVSVVDGDDKISSKAICSNTTEGDHSTEKVFQNLLQTEWVGTVTLLGPEIWSRQDGDATSQPWHPFTKAKGAPQVAMQQLNNSGAHLVYLIAGMLVMPHARRKGHGQQLVEALVGHVREKAKNLGASNASIILHTGKSATRARLFYEQVGFEAREESVMDSSTYTAMVRDVDLQMNE